MQKVKEEMHRPAREDKFSTPARWNFSLVPKQRAA